MGKDIFVALCLLAGGIGPVNAQTSCYPLVITEVSAEQATIDFTNGFFGVDFFVLANFGPTPFNLDGFAFAESRRTLCMVKDSFTNLAIDPGESIIFFRYKPLNSCVTNADAFKRWWGEANLPSAQKIRSWDYPGLDGQSPGDEVWLYDSETNVVDMVTFPESVVGRTFINDPETGRFGKISSLGENGAWKAPWGGDIGSPGRLPPSIPLRIEKPPTSQTNDGGSDAVFSVEAIGLPRPKYQWTFQGQPISGAIGSTLILSNVQPANAGDYQVMLDSCFAQLTSAVATLTVNTNDHCPEIWDAPSDQTVFQGQTAPFSVQARGYPQPRYQWQANGENLAGATNATLLVSNCVFAMSGTRYTVLVSNDLPSCSVATASAILTVPPRPVLKITEIMPWPRSTDLTGHRNWFELSNCGTNAVDLKGTIFYDTQPRSALGFAEFLKLPGINKITNSIMLQPRESMIFVDTMTAEQFIAWWGRANLPPGLKIYTWRSFSLNNTGEQLYFWNGAATDPFDPVVAASWASCAEGVSLMCDNWCDECCGCVGSCLQDSGLSGGGAWMVPAFGDLGSPGVTSFSRPHFFEAPPPHLPREPWSLNCRGAEGKTYRLYSTTSLSDVHWIPIQTQTVTTGDFRFLFQVPLGTNCHQFLRLEELP